MNILSKDKTITTYSSTNNNPLQNNDCLQITVNFTFYNKNVTTKLSGKILSFPVKTEQLLDPQRLGTASQAEKALKV